MSKNCIINKTNAGTGPAWSRQISDTKTAQKTEMLPVTFDGGLYKSHGVLCSKIVVVHAIEVHEVRT